jgi:hypothetical protein
MTIANRPTTWLAGAISDLPTPFDDDDGIDFAAFERLCERQIEAGAEAIVVAETAGEIAEPVRARSMMDHRKSPKSSAAPPPFALEDAQMCIENRDERLLSFIAAA